MPWGVRAAWAVLLIGVIVSGAVALTRLSNLHRADRAEFQVTANDVSATFAAALKSDVEVVDTLRAIASLEPDLTTAALRAWRNEIGRGVEPTSQFGTAIIEVVPASRVASFAQRFEADPGFVG